MPGTWYKVEQLRNRQNKVEYLRYKEHQHCLAEVSKDTESSKCHSSEVTECISHKYFRRIPEDNHVIFVAFSDE